jgi:hypothetical protein
VVNALADPEVVDADQLFNLFDSNRLHKHTESDSLLNGDNLHNLPSGERLLKLPRLPDVIVDHL